MPTFKGYVYNIAAPGLPFTGSQHWKIDADAFVGSQNEVAVLSSFNASTLVNEGQIYSALNLGILFTGSNSTIVNDIGASIFANGGVFVGGGDGMVLTNHGSIKGFVGDGVLSKNTTHFVLENDGDIYGHSHGVNLFSNVGGLTGQKVDNAGVIRSDHSAISVSLVGNERATVINEQGGIIDGDPFAISVGSGSLSLRNHGKLMGDVRGGSFGDRVVSDGAIKGDVHLGAGNDFYENAGGTAGMIFGELGNDELIAGPHKDKIVFNTALNAATNVDTVEHFEPGTDKLYLDQSIFTMLTGPGTLHGGEFHKGSHAADANDYVIYNPDNGRLFYDSDGAGGAHKVRFATLDIGLSLHHDDFIVMA